MSVVWVAFIIGGFFGLLSGVMVMSLCVVAGRADADSDRMFGTIVPGDAPSNTLPPRLPRP